MASVRKRSWKSATGEAKTAWIVDYANNLGRRQHKHFQTKKATDHFRINIEGQCRSAPCAAAHKVTVQDACKALNIARGEPAR